VDKGSLARESRVKGVGRPSTYEGILINRVKEWMSRYKIRDPTIIYVHNLDDTVWYTLSHEDRKDHVNGYTLIGELVHSGAMFLFNKGEERCKEIWLTNGFVKSLDQRVIERFIHYHNNSPYVVICGSCDFLVEVNGRKIPVELKTTRRRLGPESPIEWIRRTKAYGWLYDSDIAYLIIINVVSDEERDVEVRSYTDEEMSRIIRKWLRGEWPKCSLQ